MGQSRTGILALLVLCLGSISISCNVSRSTSIPSTNEGSVEGTPRILFLNYEISRDSVNVTYSARLINSVVTEGSIKKDKTPPVQTLTGDLELQVLDVNQQLMGTVHIPNPLDKSVEFVNDTGNLQHKNISLETAEFSVRLQVEPGAATAVLRQITGPGSKRNVLLKTSIL